MIKTISFSNIHDDDLPDLEQAMNHGRGKEYRPILSKSDESYVHTSTKSLLSTGTLMHTDRYQVGHDVYGLIFVAPVFSTAYVFALLVIFVKYSLFFFIIFDQYRQASKQNALFMQKDQLIRATQFFLLPLAIALQEDLIYVYTRVANIKYSKEILKTTPYATKTKFALSFALRLMDGIASLTVNFVLILTTNTVLGIVLNFAATHFLQGIDDVAFQMASEGFLGDRMEDRCKEVESTSLARRVGDSFTNALDSVLFLLTYFCMVGVWIYVYIYEEKVAAGL